MEPRLIVGLIMLVVMLLLLGCGVWIGVAMGLVGMASLYFIYGSGSLQAIGYIGYNCLNSFTLSALPLYIFMATVLGASGLTDRFYTGAAALFARIPGGLLHANIFGCALFASVCGSSAACAAAMGTVAVPTLRKRNYDMGLGIGSLVGAGTLGMMIPPSLCMIVYGMLTETSVGQLFMAGIVPGLMLTFLFMTYILLYAVITKKVPREKALGPKDTFLSVLGVWPLAILLAVTLGSIYLGVATPTEAGGIGAFGAVIIALFTKGFSWKTVVQALDDGLKLTVMLGLIIVGAFLMASTLANLGIPHLLARLVTEMNLTPLQFVAIISAFYLVLGCVMDGLAMTVTTIPVIFPVIEALGLDPVWFGILVVIYGEMAAITPPVGINLFVMQGITGEPLEKIARGSMPFVIILMLTIVILYAFPQIALLLPSTMRTR